MTVKQHGEWITALNGKVWSFLVNNTIIQLALTTYYLDEDHIKLMEILSACNVKERMLVINLLLEQRLKKMETIAKLQELINKLIANEQKIIQQLSEKTDQCNALEKQLSELTGGLSSLEQSVNFAITQQERQINE